MDISNLANSNLDREAKRILEEIEYENIIRELSKGESGEGIDKFIENKDFRHARIVISQILERAKNEVWILTDKFNERFYRSLLDDLILFLEKKRKIKILLLENSKENSIISALKYRFPEKLEVRKVPEDLKKKLTLETEGGKLLNFIIDDNNGVRYELLENMNKNITNALVNFGNKSFHKILKLLFEKLWNKSEEVAM
jgi:hypothetical protein